MKRGKILVEQITKDGIVTEGYDESLSPSEIYDCLAKYFPNLHKSEEDGRFLVGCHKGHTYAIRCKNVTYLGNPHPLYKKRIQISDDLYEFYRFAKSIKASPILMGIYSYRDNVIFVDFKIDTYIEKKAHNSSAHIYVSDLAAATDEGYFQKIDFFGNTITAFHPDITDVYLDEFFETYEISVDDTELSKPAEPVKHQDEASVRMAAYVNAFKKTIFPKIRTFFDQETKEWHGITCYQKMIKANYKNKYQPEWAGFFLEFEFEKYITENNLNHLITYKQDKTKGGIDLDLFFPTIESYGDLKAHSEDSRGIQGNDWDTIFGIISKQDEKSHIYYIVCEHSTEKDSLHEYEVTRFWNSSQGKANLMSYAKKMKNSVRLKRVYILDINYSNHEHLTMFRQGLNSNGRPRAPKIMIEHDNLPCFIIEQMTL